MLIYLIDAFNVIHKVPGLSASDTPRSDFIDYIRKNNLTGSGNNKVVVVFDGHAPQSDTPRGPYEILFSRDTSADDVIKKKTGSAKNKSQIVVVTDDRAIRDYVRPMGATALSTGDFLHKAKKSAQTSGREDISYSLQHEITEEMRKIWDKK